MNSAPWPDSGSPVLQSCNRDVRGRLGFVSVIGRTSLNSAGCWRPGMRTDLPTLSASRGLSCAFLCASVSSGIKWDGETHSIVGEPGPVRAIPIPSSLG